MKTKMPSEVFGSPSAVDWVLWRKKPRWVAPELVRVRIFCLHHSSVSYEGCSTTRCPEGGAKGERWVAPLTVSATSPWMSPIVSTGSWARQDAGRAAASSATASMIEVRMGGEGRR